MENWRYLKKIAGIFGVDPDKDLLKIVKKKYSLRNIYSQNFEEIKFKKNFFDLIVVSGSLEHVNDLNKVMKKLNYTQKSQVYFSLDSKGFPNSI